MCWLDWNFIDRILIVWSLGWQGGVSTLCLHCVDLPAMQTNCFNSIDLVLGSAWWKQCIPSTISNQQKQTFRNYENTFYGCFLPPVFNRGYGCQCQRIKFQWTFAESSGNAKEIYGGCQWSLLWIKLAWRRQFAQKYFGGGSHLRRTQTWPPRISPWFVYHLFHHHDNIKLSK